MPEGRIDYLQKIDGFVPSTLASSFTLDALLAALSRVPV
jgi:hypothetical protein